MATTDTAPPRARPDGRLAGNIVHFARTLRTAGLRVGPGQVLRAIEAVEAAGLRNRDDFYWTLHSVFVNRRDQREIFDQAFHVYWRNPRLLEKMMEMLLPSIGVPAAEDQKQLSRRLQEALQPGRGEAPEEESEPPEVEVEATFTVSDREVLQTRDFEQMSQAEIDEALRAIWKGIVAEHAPIYIQLFVDDQKAVAIRLIDAGIDFEPDEVDHFRDGGRSRVEAMQLLWRNEPVLISLYSPDDLRGALRAIPAERGDRSSVEALLAATPVPGVS